MKKVTFVLAVLAFFVVAAYAGQSSSRAQSTDQNTAKSSTANPPLRTIAGMISDDGKAFTLTKAASSGTLKNPEDVKGHEG